MKNTAQIQNKNDSKKRRDASSPELLLFAFLETQKIVKELIRGSKPDDRGESPSLSHWSLRFSQQPARTEATAVSCTAAVFQNRRNS